MTFEVSRRGFTSNPRNNRPPTIKEFATFALAEAHLEHQVEKLRRGGYYIEYRRRPEQRIAELLAAAEGERVSPLIWQIWARRGLRPGRGFSLTMWEVEAVNVVHVHPTALRVEEVS